MHQAHTTSPAVEVLEDLTDKRELFLKRCIFVGQAIPVDTLYAAFGRPQCDTVPVARYINRDEAFYLTSILKRGDDFA